MRRSTVGDDEPKLETRYDTPSPANPLCDTGIQVFRAHTGAHASIEAVDLGFPPIEVVVSR